MAAPQFPFLWPLFFLTSRPVSRTAADAASKYATRAPRRAAFTSTARPQRQGNPTKRYGTANEPPAHLGGGKATKHPDTSKDVKPAPSQQNPQQQQQQQQQQSQEQKIPSDRQDARDEAGRVSEKLGKTHEESEAEENTAQEQHQRAEATAKTVTPIGENYTAEQSATEPPSTSGQSELVTPPSESPDALNDPSLLSDPQGPSAIPLPSTPLSESLQDSSNALTKILQMEPPISDSANTEDKPPHLQAPPYVHHFDSHTLVKTLKDQGQWSENQSIDIMKAVRGILAANMELARDGLVSKGDAEMESYLFRAAVSELRTEIRQRRDAKAQEMSTSRTSLQHEVEILSQRISQDTTSLKDELKGMFDDRKMAVRMERREMENRIQELNYKITIALNSEMRSEVEGLRWVMTRRTVIALATIVIMSLFTLRYAKYAEQQQELERKKLEAQTARNRGPGPDGSGDRSGGGGGASGRDAPFDPISEEIRRRIEAGENPSLVSMG